MDDRIPNEYEVFQESEPLVTSVPIISNLIELANSLEKKNESLSNLWDSSKENYKK